MNSPSTSLEQFAPGVLPVHRHSTSHACLVLGGAMVDRKWKGTDLPATPGALLVNPARTTHEIEAGPEGLRCVVVEWGPGVEFARFRRRQSAAGAAPVMKNVSSLEEDNPARQIIVGDEIAMTVRRAIEDRDEVPPGWLEEARTAMRHCSGAASVQDMAQWAGVHRATLSRRFRDSFGMAPERFNLLVKLERAADLLLEGERLAAAAVRSGFADQPHLTRVWRRFLGAPPRRWLKERATIVQEPHRGM